LLNVNIPPIKENEIAGVQITHQGQSKYLERYDKRVDPANRVYYWLTGQKIEIEESIDNDDYATKKNYISVTPLQFDFTNYKFIDVLKSWNITP